MSGAKVVKCAGCKTYYNQSSVSVCTCGAKGIIVYNLQKEQCVAFETVEGLRRYIEEEGIIENNWRLAYSLLVKALAEVGYKLTEVALGG